MWLYAFPNLPKIGIGLAIILVLLSTLYIVQSIFWIYRLEKMVNELKVLNWVYKDSNLKRQRLVHIVLGYLLMLLMFATIYHYISFFNSRAFSAKMDIGTALYFSIVTSATVGYGDLTPCDLYARLAVCIEILAGLVYAFTIFAVLPNYLKEMEK